MKANMSKFDPECIAAMHRTRPCCMDSAMPALQFPDRIHSRMDLLHFVDRHARADLDRVKRARLPLPRMDCRRLLAAPADRQHHAAIGQFTDDLQRQFEAASKLP